MNEIRFTMRGMHARPATAGAYTLGEGPVWDPVRERLLWVDIAAGKVHAGRLRSDDTIAVTDAWSYAGTVGAVAVAVDGRMLVAERETLTCDGAIVARVLEAGGTRGPDDTGRPDNSRRLNDGAVDPAGRFLVGSLGQGRGEVLVRLDDTGLTVIDDDLALSNGLAWSPDGTFLYSVDTIPAVIRGREYDPATGATSRRRELFRISDGLPDGMCADADGHLWIAVWGGGRVECRTPAGRLLATIVVAAPHTTSVAFAGPALDVLVITTATDELSPEELRRYPDSGRVFTCRPGVAGLPVPYWSPPASLG